MAKDVLERLGGEWQRIAARLRQAVDDSLQGTLSPEQLHHVAEAAQLAVDVEACAHAFPAYVRQSLRDDEQRDRGFE